MVSSYSSALCVLSSYRTHPQNHISCMSVNQAQHRTNICHCIYIIKLTKLRIARPEADLTWFEPLSITLQPKTILVLLWRTTFVWTVDSLNSEPGHMSALFPSVGHYLHTWHCYQPIGARDCLHVYVLNYTKLCWNWISSSQVRAWQLTSKFSYQH